MPEPYVTQDELEIFMETLVDDDLATLSLNAAMASVRKFLGQEITFHADDEVELDGRGKDSLLLPEQPVRKVSTVSVDGSSIEPSTLLLRDGMLFKRSGGSTWGSVWQFGRGNVAVKYDHGWDVGDETSSSGGDPEFQVPADIVLVTLGIARRAYNDGGEFASDVAGETIGNYAYTNAASEAVLLAAVMLKGEKMILEQYKAKRVP
jgi:hypothetical protein